jgi:2-oxo-4-hydroxy-4-carboxy-5-ureidoimidazoline decarboxylase
MAGRLTLASLNAMDRPQFVEALAGIFEHSPWIHDATYEARPFSSAEALHARMVAIVNAAGEEKQRALLEAHPELAGKAARERRLTAASTAEQASAGLDRLESEESARFDALNGTYRRKFRFPFIIAVRGQRDRSAILAALERRTANSEPDEIDTALAEVAKIAWFRLSDLIVMNGRLTTHALDTRLGQPARNLGYALFRIDGDARALVCEGRTNGDGRAENPLLEGKAMKAGTYELVFAAGEYQVAQGNAGFYDLIPVRFEIADGNAHYHVPLLLSPFGYSTYRGS